MRVTFLLPTAIPVPVGGFIVVFEYANRLAAEGNEVVILYPEVLQMDRVKSAKLKIRYKNFKRAYRKRRENQFSSGSWFPLHTDIKEKYVPNFKEKYVPNADAVFATAWETSVWVNNYGPGKGKKFYLIQHYEKWNTTPEKVDESWRYPFEKIVISNWLLQHAKALNVKATLIPNGLDFKKFKIEKPIEERSADHVLMLYHLFEWKGSSVGIEALQIAKKRLPSLHATLFSTFPQPDGLPDWITYIRKPSDLKALYNDAAIFVSPSKEEGWGLPPAEAMQCGCATIATAVGGHLDFGKAGSDLLLVEPNKALPISDAIVDLVTNDNKRITLAKNGNKAIQKFTWEKAYAKFKEVLFHLSL